VVLFYCDDFILLARTKADLEAAMETMRSALWRSPAGHLEIGREQTSRVCDGLRHLGYHVRRRCGAVEFRPIAKRLQSFAEKLAASLKVLAAENYPDKERKRFRRLVTSWRNSFREADLYDPLMDALEYCRSRLRCQYARAMITGLMREVAAHVPPRIKRRPGRLFFGL
jgi:hypothetical protein